MSASTRKKLAGRIDTMPVNIVLRNGIYYVCLRGRGGVVTHMYPLCSVEDAQSITEV